MSLFGRGSVRRVKSENPSKLEDKTDSQLQQFSQRFSIDAQSIRETISEDDQTTWYMELLLGLAGTLAAIFALSFFGSLLSIVFAQFSEMYTLFLFFGFMLLLVSLYLRTEYTKSFLRHFLNSFIFAGYAMIIFGLSGFGWNNEILPVIAFFLALWIIYMINDPIIEFLFSCAMVACIMWAYITWKVPHILIVFIATTTIIAMACLTRPFRKRVYQPAGNAFLVIPALIILMAVAASIQAYYVGYKAGLTSLTSIDHWLSASIFLLGALYLNLSIGIKRWQDFDPPLFIILPITLCCVILPIGASIMLLAIMTGYILGEKSVAILGVLIEIAFLVWFYYDLSTTLLVKSLILIFVGLVCLFLWYLALPDSRFRKRTTQATTS